MSSTFKAMVRVFLKAGVLDVQGKAVEQALHGLGFPGVADVRVGRLIQFEVAAADADEARTQVEAMCRRLLANPVIESFEVEIA